MLLLKMNFWSEVRLHTSTELIDLLRNSWLLFYIIFHRIGSLQINCMLNEITNYLWGMLNLKHQNEIQSASFKNLHPRTVSFKNSISIWLVWVYYSHLGVKDYHRLHTFISTSSVKSSMWLCIYGVLLKILSFDFPPPFIHICSQCLANYHILALAVVKRSNTSITSTQL